MKKLIIDIKESRKGCPIRWKGKERKNSNSCLYNFHCSVKVRGSVSPRFRGAADIVHHDRLPRNARYANINRIHPKAARVFKEVVVLPGRRPPRLSSVGTNLQRFNRDVRVDNLDTEPVFRGPILGFQEQRTADVALDDLPVHVNSADFEVCQLFEASGEQINIVQSTTSRTLVDNLRQK